MIYKADGIIDAFGNEINLWQTKESYRDAPNILLAGRFHGDEPEGEFVIRHMMRELAKKSYVSPYNIYFLPCLNPSGKKLFTRANGRGVDLNRNYPTQNFSSQSVNPHTKSLFAGSPASEVETRFMMDIVEKYKFVRILSVHSDLHLIDYDGPARELAVQFSQKCGYRLVDDIGYPTNGSFGTWAGIEKQIPLLTVETPKGRTEAQMHKIMAQLHEAIADFCQLQ